jgi:hypothetical protein
MPGHVFLTRNSLMHKPKLPIYQIGALQDNAAKIEWLNALDIECR